MTAAFIGPGTVVTASRAGTEFGYGLLWIVALSVFCAIVLQNAAARLGVLSGQGLGEYIRERLKASFAFVPIAVLVVVAMGIGNAAYQTGNLTGASVGALAVFGGSSTLWVAILTAVCAALILSGTYRNLQAILIGLVGLLSLAFIATAFTSWPRPIEVASGFVPSPETFGSTLAIALVGTTIVPYNLFLHASGAAKNWRGVQSTVALRQSRTDTVIAITLGGIVTAAVVITAATVFHRQGSAAPSLGELSSELEPILGRFASLGFGAGMFAAGLTSSITAPLATAYAICGILGWPTELNSIRFRAIALLTLFVGAAAALIWGAAPVNTIVIAQVANGLLLPFIAILVVWASFDRRALGASIAEFGVCALVCTLAIWKIVAVWIPRG